MSCLESPRLLTGLTVEHRGVGVCAPLPTDLVTPLLLSYAIFDIRKYTKLSVLNKVKADQLHSLKKSCILPENIIFHE